MLPVQPISVYKASGHEQILAALPPLSLYVHFPWCIQKCPYCDFNSHVLKKDTFDEKSYIDYLLFDLESELPFVWGRSVHTVFLGGGTPSLFSADAINTLLNGIRSRIKLLPGAEITMEANPGTFEQDKFVGFKEAGVNRLSIGVQSFHDEQLQYLGRIHNVKEAKKAVTLAIDIFEKVNIDLMYALPKQTVVQAQYDVQTAIGLGVKHISAYHLTIEPNTPFAQFPPKDLPEDDLSLDIEDIVHNELGKADFEHYEVSAFSKEQNYCQHNINYWQFGDYIGIGAGAHGKISYPTHIERTVRYKHPKEYIQSVQAGLSNKQRKMIQYDDLAFEFMLNVLRLSQGVPKSLFQERTGLSLVAILPQLQKAQTLQLIEASPDLLKPTKLGKQFLNDLLGLFLKE
ncbi:radical SAM family heme chaperone HemW [Neisseria sp. Ec49-e6-T10]|uniref:radical SAM family heme chaperone HemW n=1 Tax=Neisseria sp. Ec49-e6-T10 TaxID=3140744 RepID=UPI003EC01DB3